MSKLVRSAMPLFAAATMLATSALAAPPGTRPDIRIAEGPAFSMASIPAYKGDHKDIYAYIDAHKAEDVANLQRWVRQPSVSAQNIGIKEMAALAAADLKKIGFKEAEVVPTSGHPGVWGYYDAGAAKTLAVYMMLDVQPVEEKDWQVKPFDGALVDHPLGKVLMARGATNTKGPERAFLNAVEAIIATRGKLPVNLMILAECEEELGSIHYPELIAKYADRLKTAAGSIYPGGGQSPADGAVAMQLGNKGVLYIELEAKGSATGGGPQKAEIHSSWKATTDAPAWRLAQALATLTTADGNTILVPGYYDSIRQPNAEERSLFNGTLPGWTKREVNTRKSFAIDHWYDKMDARASLTRYLFDTTLNIDGLSSGYDGPGMKTILPHRAFAKLDSRLVPDQTPEESLRLIKAHLVAKGFSDIEVRQLSGYPPSQTSVSAPLVQAVLATYNKYGLPVDVSPRSGGSRPSYVFTKTLGIPDVTLAIGHGADAHAPNEYLLIDPKPGSKVFGLSAMEKFYVDTLYALAATK
ncbi:M20/M25/M40 family metallo-hydrolase [Sphingomonas jatrophae]|uniref:Acetylornithine deacetylase/Succinyl-diaminopimelate desuccinylase n=1 Tax=Sphingomonas jatrophae TaxID=1166337 RepID=A0A1I6M3L0_9SPHN|nr:M20/M25/M40 family metallo-hydrolase [Sphingomonas jatrophae]SFS10276.1 Acetylornithine deacetylase/Succinyl-diaminopimelate desuccinylase [Sphingomonas jatrophae]